MIMRGGSLGYGIPGGTQTGSATVNGYTIPQDLTLTGNRTGAQPAEYVAANNVEFAGEFESASIDEFSAYIAGASYAGTGNQTNGGSGTNLAGGYRYGFNGKENDGDVKGDGNEIDYGARIYDPRAGRFLSVDPLQASYPWYTPYQFSGNTPIQAKDLDGLEEEHYTLNFNKEGKPQLQYVKTITEKSFLFWTWKPLESKIISYGGEKYEFTAGGFSGSPASGNYGANSFENLNEWLSEGYQEKQFGQAFYSTYAKNLMDAGSFVEGVTDDIAVGKAYAKANSHPVQSSSTTASTTKQAASANNGNTNTSTSSSTEKQLKVSTYKEAVKANSGKGLSGDHIPSFGSLKTAEEMRLGRPLSAVEEKTLKQNSLVLTIQTKIHQKASMTYGGRNTPVMQRTDAANPVQAIRNNVNALRQSLIDEGYSNEEINNAIIKLSKPYQKAISNSNK